MNKIKNLIFCLMAIIFWESYVFAEAKGNQWQMWLEQNNEIIPRLRDLSGGLTKATNSLDRLGITLQIPLLSPSAEARKGWFMGNIADIGFLFDYGQSNLGFDYNYATSATVFSVPNSNYLGYGTKILFNLPKPWKFDVRVQYDFGTISNSNINYSSYEIGMTNFARKLRGSWASSNSVLGGVYSADSIDYLFGLEAGTNRLDLTYFDYPLSPLTTESSGSASFGNSNIYVGAKYSFLDHGFAQFKYFLPVKDWLQGLDVRMGYEF